MLWWSPTSRGIARALFIVIGIMVFALPVLAIAVAAFATSWTELVPSGWTADHVREALSGENLASLSVSIQTAIIASVISVALGVTAAILSRSAPTWLATLTAGVFHIPVAVPSVAIGLGILIAFNEPPLILGGRAGIVVAAHTVLVLAFAYGSVDAALQHIDPGLYRAAESLGASPLRIFFRVTLPLLVPAIGGAAGLSLSLSMGELGATAMVYPPTWRTLPATIYGLAEHGDTLLAAACTLVLLAVTIAALAVLSRVRGNAALR
ncbi:ABC transporter permease [Mycobacterium spongiae]|uniref:ABC transporter permease subunit n=1 Tax=Mycobacterium spongiae TaxID=886343 RepID=A0A975JYJ1_9MYCO|nr:ABC transporter permease subunit [Mycobacterium spongiae]QUR68076.1 ABC transporter permease subunit [Mycobacterium spongiae]